jgi:hypothetical protein
MSCRPKIGSVGVAGTVSSVMPGDPPWVWGGQVVANEAPNEPFEFVNNDLLYAWCAANGPLTVGMQVLFDVLQASFGPIASITEILP